MTEPSRVQATNSPQEAAAHTARLWAEDWSIYFAELQRLTGLPLEQVMLFDMLCTWRDIQRFTAENYAFIRKHIEDEHRDDWEKP